MNTIKLTERELKNIGEYEPEKYFDGFIFDEYKIIIKYENFKVIYKVKFEDDINKVVYRIIKGTEYKDYEFSFVEDREKLICIDSNDKVIGGLIYENETVEERLSEDGNTKQNKLFVFIASSIRMIKQYIMNESYKRTIIQKEVTKTTNESCDSNKNKNKKNNNRSKVSVVYLLDDIVEYVSNNKSIHKFTCECWTVRGHFRHYKNGTVGWVSSYEKGSKRNSGVISKEKVYII